MGKKGLPPLFFSLPPPLIPDLWHSPSRSPPTPVARNYGDTNRRDVMHSAVKYDKHTRGNRAHCLLLRKSALRSSISSMGEEEERRELSEGFREGELLSPCSTERELGRSSRDWGGEEEIKNCWQHFQHLKWIRFTSFCFNLTILLFTSSSMALTSSAALGVSELLGRADRRDPDWKIKYETKLKSKWGMCKWALHAFSKSCNLIGYYRVFDQAHHCWVWTPIIHMSKYGLGGCELPDKRVNWGLNWSRWQAGLRKREVLRWV